MSQKIPIKDLKVGDLYKVHFPSICHTLWTSITEWSEEPLPNKYSVVEDGSVFLLLEEPILVNNLGYWFHALIEDRCGWFYMGSLLGERPDEYMTRIIPEYMTRIIPEGK